MHSLIQKDKVKLTVVFEQEAVVAILEPGQFFGRMHEWSRHSQGPF